MGAGEDTTRQQMRLWLKSEQARGRDGIRQINRQRRMMATASNGLARFTVRMALVQETGATAKWARRIHDGLIRWDERDAAEAFAAAPPFAATDPAPEDCDRLSDWIQDRVAVLADLLARQPS